MRTLVTGSGGFIGRRLRQPGERALVRRPTGDANEVVGDLMDPASLAAACEGIDTVFHCAGYAHAFGSTDPEIHWRVNFEGTRNLVEAAGRAGVCRFVFLSSVKAMAEPGEDCVDEDWPGEPSTPYGRAKRVAEEAVLEAGAKYGMQVVNLRLAMVYGHGGKGNLERMARGIRAGWFPRLPETGNRRSLVHVEDVVEVMRLVASRPEASGRTYIIADSRPYSGREIFDAIAGVSPRLTSPKGAGRHKVAVPSEARDGAKPHSFAWSVPEGLLRWAGKLGDAGERLWGRSLPIDSEVVDRLLGSACYSPARIERELGWRARVGLEEGVREMMGYRS